MSVQPGSEQEPAKSEVELTPAQKLDAYIATLGDVRTFNHLEDRMQYLIVQRRPDDSHSEPWPDNGWALTTTGIDKNGVKVGIVEKFLDPEDETPARKKINLAEAFAYTEEALRTKTPQIELAESALRVTGPANPGEKPVSSQQELAPDKAEVRDTIAVDALVGSLKDILAQAEAGMLKNSDGKSYSRGEILDIFKDFVEESDNPTVDGFDITKLIPRAGGLRDIVRGAMGYGRAAALKEAIAIISAKPSEQPKVINSPVSNPGVIEQPIPSVEIPAQETDRQMLERHLREYANDLEDLYTELRGVDPKSDDAYRLQKQIRENKEDSGRVAAKLRRL